MSSNIIYSKFLNIDGFQVEKLRITRSFDYNLKKTRYIIEYNNDFLDLDTDNQAEVNVINELDSLFFEKFIKNNVDK